MNILTKYLLLMQDQKLVHNATGLKEEDTNTKSITPTATCILEVLTIFMVCEMPIRNVIPLGMINGILEIMMRLLLKLIHRSGEN